MSFDPVSFLATLTDSPGVYVMYGANEKVLYVGKAKHLKRRVASYFRTTTLPIKTKALVAKIADMSVNVTRTDVEALLLEQNLIKENRPPYNILLRDDKSYPYLHLSTHHAYPRLSLKRTRVKKEGTYFGPYPSAQLVKETLGFVQKILQVRQCDDVTFNNRSRPCLQYQIGRCKAPCVGFVSKEDYAKDVLATDNLIRGKNDVVTQLLTDQMLQLSSELKFEEAGLLRDRIKGIRVIQQQQVADQGTADVDIFAIAVKSGLVCVQTMLVRNGKLIDSKSHFPKTSVEEDEARILQAFMEYYYLSKELNFAPQAIISHDINDREAIEQAVTIKTGHKLHINFQVRHLRRQWLDLALRSCHENLELKLQSKRNVYGRMIAFKDALGLDELPNSIECFDISHSAGEATVASCVVFNQQGAAKNEYRSFNITDITPGDDYAAMRQAVKRRYTGLLKAEAELPDVVLIDGGKGQLNQAIEIFRELAINNTLLVGVAKGEGRKRGLETLFVGSPNNAVMLDQFDPGFHLVQQIRDEAHRFAVSRHTRKRDKKRKQSELENIPGIGAKKRTAILLHFGGIEGIKAASADELKKVTGISEKLADVIHTYFNPSA